MKLTPDQRWHTAIKPIAEFCADTKGAKAAIIKRMNRIAPQSTGRPWNRQQVESYLHADPNKRFEPRMGAWLALEASAHEVMQEQYEAAWRERIKESYRRAEAGGKI